jgi:hypothetical protein
VDPIKVLRVKRHQASRSAPAGIEFDIRFGSHGAAILSAKFLKSTYEAQRKSWESAANGVVAAREREKEWRQSEEDRIKLDGLYECILSACCSTSCPSYWRNGERHLGPAALLQAYRWLIDSRDEATGERIDHLEDPFRLYRCHTIMNCAQNLPQGAQSGQGHRRDQEDDGRAARLRPGAGAQPRRRVSRQTRRKVARMR